MGNERRAAEYVGKICLNVVVGNNGCMGGEKLPIPPGQ